LYTQAPLLADLDEVPLEPEAYQNIEREREKDR